MSQRIQVKKNRKRRAITYLWIFALVLVVSLLIYFERTALLYVLATIGVTALLVIVAFADLGGGEGSDTTLLDAQAVGSGISAAQPNLVKK